MLTDRHEAVSHVQLDVEQVRRELDRMVVHLQRAIGIANGLQGIAEIAIRFGIIRLDLSGTTEISDRFLLLTETPIAATHVEMRLRVVRIQRAPVSSPAWRPCLASPAPS